MRGALIKGGLVVALLGVGLVVLGGDVAPRLLDAGDVVFLGWLLLGAVLLVVLRRLYVVPEVHVVHAGAERGARAPTPSHEVDSVLPDVSADYPTLPEDTNRSYVYPVARTLVRTTLEVELDHEPEEAGRLIERGTWTDDPVAAWFLGDERVDFPSSSLPARLRLRGVHDPDALDEYAVRRTIDAIERIREGDS